MASQKQEVPTATQSFPDGYAVVESQDGAPDVIAPRQQPERITRFPHLNRPKPVKLTCKISDKLLALLNEVCPDKETLGGCVETALFAYFDSAGYTFDVNHNVTFDPQGDLFFGS